MQRIIQQLVDRVLVDYLAQTALFRGLASRAVNAKKTAAERSVQAAMDSRVAAGEAGQQATSFLSKMKDELMKLDDQLEKAARNGR